MGEVFLEIYMSRLCGIVYYSGFAEVGDRGGGGVKEHPQRRGMG